MRTATDLACVIADGYSVDPWIDGKKTVYTVMPRVTLAELRRVGCGTARGWEAYSTGVQQPVRTTGD